MKYSIIGEDDNAKPAGTFSFQADLEILCPFCGGTVRAGHSEDSEFAVLHTIPMCSTFEKHDPVEFLTQCRLELQRRGAQA